jgi:hypothetical protein
MIRLIVNQLYGQDDCVLARSMSWAGKAGITLHLWSSNDSPSASRLHAFGDGIATLSRWLIVVLGFPPRRRSLLLANVCKALRNALLMFGICLWSCISLSCLMMNASKKPVSCSRLCLCSSSRQTETPHGSRPIQSQSTSLVIIVITTLIPALIKRIVQTIAIVLNIVPKPLNITHFLSTPLCDVLRSVLDVIHSIIPLPLHAIAKAIEALLDVVGNLLDFAHTAANTGRRVFGEVFDVVFEARFVLVPVLFCEVVSIYVSYHGCSISQEMEENILISSPSCISSAPAPNPSAAPPTPQAAALP